MKRVVIMGAGASGKSTLADRLGRQLGIPVFHLESLAWRPGWIPTPREELNEKIADLVRQDAWIIDGDQEETLDLRLSACDTAIYLDLPRWFSLWRAVKRRFAFEKVAGNGRAPSPRRWALSEWAATAQRPVWKRRFRLWTFHSKVRPRLLATLKGYEAKKSVVILKSPSEVEGFLSRPRAGSSEPARF